MIQIIKRQEGFKSEKTNFESGRPQISYNDDEHLCIRLIHDNERDTLVVLDKTTSRRLINFLQSRDLPF